MIIDEKRIAELKTMGIDNYFLDTIEALWKVARAARRLLDRTDWTSCLPGEIDDLKEALAALQEPGKGAE